MRRIALLTLLISMVFSCKKDNIDFTLKGTISDATFSGGLTGATVTLTQIPIGGSTAKVLGSAVLGTDGNYSFTFAREKVEKYVLTVDKTNYFSIDQDISFSDFSTESALERSYSTTAKSWVKLVFTNIAPATIGDGLTFNKQDGKVGCSECCPQETYTLVGLVDTTFYCVNDANTTYSYYYNVVNTINQGIESITTIPFDTVTITKTY
jgi:hypothetical protein